MFVLFVCLYTYFDYTNYGLVKNNFCMTASAFDNEYAYMLAREDDIVEKLEIKDGMTETQKREIYVFYIQANAI